MSLCQPASCLIEPSLPHPFVKFSSFQWGGGGGGLGAAMSERWSMRHGLHSLLHLSDPVLLGCGVCVIGGERWSARSSSSCTAPATRRRSIHTRSRCCATPARSMPRTQTRDVSRTLPVRSAWPVCSDRGRCSTSRQSGGTSCGRCHPAFRSAFGGLDVETSAPARPSSLLYARST